jgi:hypothetical protein
MGNPLDFNVDRVLDNVRRSSTADLLSRATVFRQGMEPKALQLIEGELASRGLSPDEIEEYGEKLRQEMIVAPDGLPVRCDFCHQPAVAQGWDWHRLWGRFPVFPRYFSYCGEHRPPAPEEPEDPESMSAFSE